MRSLAVLLALAAGCQMTMRTRIVTGGGQPGERIDEQGTCDTAPVVPGETCTEHQAPDVLATTAAIVAVAAMGVLGAVMLDRAGFNER